MDWALVHFCGLYRGLMGLDSHFGFRPYLVCEWSFEIYKQGTWSSAAASAATATTTHPPPTPTSTAAATTNTLVLEYFSTASASLGAIR